jgi:hypothetical protein
MEIASSAQASASPTAAAFTPATSTRASAPVVASGSDPSGDGDTPEEQYETLKGLVAPYCERFGRAKMMAHFASLGAQKGPDFLEPNLQENIPKAIALLRKDLGAQ